MIYEKNVVEQMIGLLRTPIAQRKGVTIPPDECAIWAKELEMYLKEEWIHINHKLDNKSDLWYFFISYNTTHLKAI